MQVFDLVRTVLDELYERVPGNSEEEKDTLIKERLVTLGDKYSRLSVENTIDHSDTAGQFAYIYKYVTAHANIAFQLISSTQELVALFNNDSIRATCIGGGPGSDYLGILKYLFRAQKKPFLQCTLYDREKSWGECWYDIDTKIHTEMHVSTYFEQADITDSREWDSRRKYLKSDLYSMVYFLSEVYHIKSEAEPFFVHLFEKIQSGAIIMFVDNNSPQFVDWFDRMISAAPVDVVRRYNGWVQIDDFSEEKKLLGRYFDKYAEADGGNPKLRSNVAYRVCIRR
jgi:ribosomal protein RSM22 (predicted rRNA methylase)